MKLKTYINNVIAILAVLTLVGGFQLDTTLNNNTDDQPITIESVIGVQEAYAGPCGDAGCVGKVGYCGVEVTILKVLDWELKKECHGKDASDGTKPIA